jgi:hypothetical protein
VEKSAVDAVPTPVLPPIRKWQVAYFKAFEGRFNRATVD